MVRCRVQYPVPGIRLQEHSPYQAMFPPANDAGAPEEGVRGGAVRIVGGRDMAPSQVASGAGRRGEAS